MIEEIKEILEELKEKNETYKECSENGIIENEYYKSHILLDYITNLQEENENKDNKILELQLELLSKKINVKDIEYKEKMIYKSRCEKAIEYIKSFYETPEYIDAYDITYWTDKVMEILQGGGEE